MENTNRKAIASVYCKQVIQSKTGMLGRHQEGNEENGYQIHRAIYIQTQGSSWWCEYDLSGAA